DPVLASLVGMFVIDLVPLFVHLSTALLATTLEKKLVSPLTKLGMDELLNTLSKRRWQRVKLDELHLASVFDPGFANLGVLCCCIANFHQSHFGFRLGIDGFCPCNIDVSRDAFLFTKFVRNMFVKRLRDWISLFRFYGLDAKRRGIEASNVPGG